MATRRETPNRATMPSQPASTDSAPLHWLLRISGAAEFVGHGAFGVMTKAVWVPYFGVIGIPPELAWKLMPLVGTVDITIGLSVWIHQTRPRAAALYGRLGIADRHDAAAGRRAHLGI